MGGLFYVYEHWRPDRDTCFYVGKGKGGRANDMKRGRNRFHKFIQNKLSRMSLLVEVRMVRGGLDEESAFALEKERIAFWKNSGVDIANLTSGGEGPSGMIVSEETRRKHSISSTGRKLSEDAKKAISLSAIGNTRGLGKKRPVEAIDATRKANTGKKRSEETKLKLRLIRINNPTFAGKHHTADTIEKISAPQRGRPKSEETKARMRKPKSEEHKLKLSLANIGKTHSPETLKKISENSRQQWAKRKSLSLMQKE